MKRITLLLTFTLVGCSHKSPAPISVIEPTAPVVASRPKPPSPASADLSTQSGPPGVLKYWNTGRDNVWSLAYGLDGKYLATEDGSNLVKVLTAQSGKLLRSYQCPGYANELFAYSANGRWLAINGEQNLICLIDTQHLSMSRRLPRPDDAYSLQFSRDSRRLLAAGKSITIWNTGTGQRLFHHNTSDTAFLMPNGRHFLRCSQSGKIRLCDAKTGKVRKSWQEPRSVNNSYYLKALSQNGKMLAVEKFEEGYITDAQGSIGFQKCSLRLLNSHTGRLLRVLRGDKVNPNAAFSPRGEILANWSFDDRGPDQLAFWNIRTGQYKQVYSVGVLSAAFSPDGKTVAMSDTMGGINIFRVPNWQ